jgi:hypothetical protein
MKNASHSIVLKKSYIQQITHAANNVHAQYKSLETVPDALGRAVHNSVQSPNF